MAANDPAGTRVVDPIEADRPRLARWLFESRQAAWIWLIARLWLGWTWLHAGWGKVFGGEITLRFWDWDQRQYALTGDANIGWVRSSGEVEVGDAVAGFADQAIKASSGPHPEVAYGWYVAFLEWIRDFAYPVMGPLVAVGEVVIGVLLILGLATGVAAALGALLNFTYAFAGAAGENPAMILVSVLLILAWRDAGWYGLDRWWLPRWRRARVAGVSRVVGRRRVPPSKG